MKIEITEKYFKTSSVHMDIISPTELKPPSKTFKEIVEETFRVSRKRRFG